ncbi:MAG: hypothetical protein AAF975_05550, partial [Spirochaetota bacterium]
MNKFSVWRNLLSCLFVVSLLTSCPPLKDTGSQPQKPNEKCLQDNRDPGLSRIQRFRIRYASQNNGITGYGDWYKYQEWSGNVLKIYDGRGREEYTYDSKGRLTKHLKGSVTKTYRYEGECRQILRSDYNRYYNYEKSYVSENGKEYKNEERSKNVRIIYNSDGSVETKYTYDDQGRVIKREYSGISRKYRYEG